ncbi:MAG TPA: hypothetical protein VNA13_01125 [Xanthomonadales bacterium]|nr:hypothetical protein [Xanthomonadales bacterium]
MPVQIDRIERSFGRVRSRSQITLTQEPTVLDRQVENRGALGLPWVYVTTATLSEDEGLLSVVSTQKAIGSAEVGMVPRVKVFDFEDGLPSVIAEFRPGIGKRIAYKMPHRS